MAGVPVSPAEAIRAGVQSALDEVHTSMPAEVTAYDPLTNVCFVRPSLKQGIFSPEGKRTYVELPEIPFVPVIWPRAGNFVMRFPVSAGDRVLLVFSEGGLAEWKRSGGVSTPQDARRMSLGWPVAIPGLYPTTEPLSPLDAAAVAAGSAIFGEDGGQQIRIGPLGIEFANAGVTPIAPVALAPPIVAMLTALSAWVALAGPLITTPAVAAALPGPQQAAYNAAVAAVAASVGALANVPSTLVKAF